MMSVTKKKKKKQASIAIRTTQLFYEGCMDRSCFLKSQERFLHSHWFYSLSYMKSVYKHKVMNLTMHNHLFFYVMRLAGLFEGHFFMTHKSKYLGDMMFWHENLDSTAFTSSA